MDAITFNDIFYVTQYILLQKFLTWGCFIDERERERERKRERDVQEKHSLAASHMQPDWGSNPQLRYTP